MTALVMGAVLVALIGVSCDMETANQIDGKANLNKTQPAERTNGLANVKTDQWLTAAEWTAMQNKVDGAIQSALAWYQNYLNGSYRLKVFVGGSAAGYMTLAKTNGSASDIWSAIKTWLNQSSGDNNLALAPATNLSTTTNLDLRNGISGATNGEISATKSAWAQGGFNQNPANAIRVDIVANGGVSGSGTTASPILVPLGTSLAAINNKFAIVSPNALSPVEQFDALWKPSMAIPDQWSESLSLKTILVQRFRQGELIPWRK
jgi:hypothetical protein